MKKDQSGSSGRLGRRWAGRIFGTNQGNIYLELETATEPLSGTLRLLDRDFGLCVYTLTANFDGTRIEITGEPIQAQDNIELSNLTASADLNDKGELHGEWSTELGTGGTFVLFPHDGQSANQDVDSARPRQFFTKRVSFKSVEITKSDIEQIGESFQKDLPSGEVIITLTTSTSSSSYLQDFKKEIFNAPRGEFAKVYISEPEGNGMNRVLSLEFGQGENFGFSQSADESWALGRIEKLKQEIAPYERSYALSGNRLGIGVNQFLLLILLAYLPSIGSVTQRVIFSLIMVAIIVSFTKAHNYLIPNALIRLAPSKQNALIRNGSKFVSWALGLFTMVLATVIANKIDFVLSLLNIALD